MLISSLLSDHTPYLSEKDHQFAPPPITRFLTFQRIGLLNHGLHGKSGELPPWPDARKRLPFPKYGYIENLFPSAVVLEPRIFRKSSGARYRRRLFFQSRDAFVLISIRVFKANSY